MLYERKLSVVDQLYGRYPARNGLRGKQATMAATNLLAVFSEVGIDYKVSDVLPS